MTLNTNDLGSEWVTIARKAFWLGLLLLILLIPLVFSPSLNRAFETPKALVLRAGVMLLVLWWAILKLEKNTTCFLAFGPVTKALFLFVVSFGLSTFFSIDPVLSLFGTYDRQIGFIGVGAATGFSLLVAGELDTWEKARSVLRVMVLSGTISSCYGLVQYWGFDPLEWLNGFDGRPSSTLGHPDFWGDFVAITIPATLSLCYEEKRRSLRTAWIVSLLIQFGALLASQTRGAWVAASLAVLTFIILEPFVHRNGTILSPKKTISSLIALSLLAGLVIFPLTLNQEFRQRATSISRWKEQPRLYLWRDTLPLIQKYPILGSGPETFRVSFMPYKSLKLATMERNVNYDNPHNHFLYLWATTGLFGIAAFLFIIFCCFSEAMKKIKTDKPFMPPPLSLGIITSLEAYIIAMLTGIDTIPTIFYFYTLAALIAGGYNCEGTTIRGATRFTVKRYFLIALALIFVLACYDSYRCVHADRLALTALRSFKREHLSLPEAHALLKRSCSLLPRQSFYPLQLGAVCLKIAQSEPNNGAALRESLEWGYRSLRHSWSPENSYHLLSMCYLYGRHFSTSKRIARQGLALDPNNVALRSTLALSLAHQGRHKEALKEVEMALSINPSQVTAVAIKKWLTVTPPTNEFSVD